MLTAHAENCVTTKTALLDLVQNKNFSSEWIETTQNDGKPLLIKMQERAGQLYFVFDKTKEGIWAEGVIKVCRERDRLLVKISQKDIRVGEAAPWLIKISMKRGAEFRLDIKGQDKMHVSITGWSGDFVPVSGKP